MFNERSVESCDTLFRRIRKAKDVSYLDLKFFLQNENASDVSIIRRIFQLPAANGSITSELLKQALEMTTNEDRCVGEIDPKVYNILHKSACRHCHNDEDSQMFHVKQLL